eukprot:TRINITY_DN37102_c0_g1_i1.p3 TRINITY_DN37102_c0_g1~~TRINITY_DN37102_c0_g1_i1.p3  ORF type:complete len:120 (+),score=11.56 TRINITY_DN37102_c0_g1_i1:32-361(+)
MLRSLVGSEMCIRDRSVFCLYCHFCLLSSLGTPPGPSHHQLALPHRPRREAAGCHLHRHWHQHAVRAVGAGARAQLELDQQPFLCGVPMRCVPRTGRIPECKAVRPPRE